MGRLFVALRLPPSVRRALTEWRVEIPGVRWTPPEQLHLTLRFIGSTNPSPVKEALLKVISPPVTVSFERVRLFPRSSKPRVLAATVLITPELQTLHARIETALEQAGIDREGRPFRPHVTLARCKNADPASLKAILEETGLQANACELDAFHLFESFLHPEGPKHTILESYPLSQ
ncbi:MAG: RNA 2',3'-cyclic phosphodiesterase [Bacteroidetes bacterium]|nr:RNA 2',3'-cyclic phosphodiesterase [Bacteroidota bacterium]